MDVKDSIFKAYQLVDNSLLDCAGTALRAYNWTTGRTKADLANKLSTVAAGAEIAGIMGMTAESAFVAVGAILSTVDFWITHVKQNYNLEIEKAEREALERGVIDPKVQHYKKNAAWAAPALLCISGTIPTNVALVKKNQTELSPYDISLATGIAIRGAAEYVMRVDNLPPRKDCIRRGMDKLSEIVEKYRPKPEPQLG